MTTAAAPAPSAPNVFYRYHTSDGRVVIVDSLERIPATDRARAERVELEAPSATTSYPVVSQVAAQMDWPSFATGFGVALGLAAILSFVGRGSSRLLGMLVVVAIVVAAGGAYFGWLRRTTGQSDAAFASPSAIIDDARKAVQKANQRQRDQEKLLDEIQRTK